jgi:prepilin-type processing-associated H-X9-DG protein
MAQEWLTPRKKVSVQSEGDKTATVVVGEDKEPKPLTLVLIEEDGTWGVDVLETYAKWHNLEGAAKAMAIYKLTGVELPELPVTGEFVEARENARRFSCQSNLKQIMLGIKMYAQDYDEKLPPAKQWIDVLQPYLKSGAIFNCPSVPKGQRYGYAYNAKLSQKNESILGESYKVVTLYETSALKRNAYGMGEGLTFRHSDGANYAFEDGHVKWLSKANVPSFNLGRTVAPSPAP